MLCMFNYFTFSSKLKKGKQANFFFQFYLIIYFAVDDIRNEVFIYLIDFISLFKITDTFFACFNMQRNQI